MNDNKLNDNKFNSKNLNDNEAQNGRTLVELNYCTENAIKLASYLERAITIIDNAFYFINADGWPESEVERNEVRKLLKLYAVDTDKSRC